MQNIVTIADRLWIGVIKMYKSPIELVTSNIMTEIAKKQDEQIMRAIQSVGVNVDKEELIKALNYDRQQYDKGYRDGARELAERLKPILFNYYDSDIDNLLKEMVGENK